MILELPPGGLLSLSEGIMRGVMTHDCPIHSPNPIGYCLIPSYSLLFARKHTRTDSDIWCRGFATERISERRRHLRSACQMGAENLHNGGVFSLKIFGNIVHGGKSGIKRGYRRNKILGGFLILRDVSQESIKICV